MDCLTRKIINQICFHQPPNYRKCVEFKKSPQSFAVKTFFSQTTVFFPKKEKVFQRNLPNIATRSLLAPPSGVLCSKNCIMFVFVRSPAIWEKDSFFPRRNIVFLKGEKTPKIGKKKPPQKHNLLQKSYPSLVFKWFWIFVGGKICFVVCVKTSCQPSGRTTS